MEEDGDESGSGLSERLLPSRAATKGARLEADNSSSGGDEEAAGDKEVVDAGSAANDAALVVGRARRAAHIGSAIAALIGCAGALGGAGTTSGTAEAPIPVYVWLYTACAALAAVRILASMRTWHASPAATWGVGSGVIAVFAAALMHSAAVRLHCSSGAPGLAACDVVATSGWSVAVLIGLGCYLRAPPQQVTPAAKAAPPSVLAAVLAFADLNALFEVGVTRQLGLRDVPRLPPGTTTPSATNAWDAACATLQLQSAAQPADNPRGSPLLRILVALYGWRWIGLGILQAASVALSFCGPLCLNQLLDYLSATPGTSAASPWLGLAWTAVMTAGALASAVVSTQFSARALRVQTELRAGVLASVFSAMLAPASAGGRAGLTAGRVTNFVSVDVQKLQDAVTSLHQLWALPVQVAVTLYLLYTQVAFAFLAGLAVLAVFVPINMVVSRRIGTLTGVMMTARDGRVARTGELLAGIRTVKMQAWEVPLLARIAVARAEEVRALAARKYLDAVCVFLWAATPVLVSLATFATVVLLIPRTPGTPALSAASVFTTVSLLGLLIFPLNAFSWVVTGVLEAVVSLRRLDAFLYPPLQPAAAAAAVVLPSLPPPPHVVARLCGNFTFPSTAAAVAPAPSAGVTTRFTLRMPAAGLDIPARGLTLVVGAVGGGKTALLRALLGDMVPAAAGSDTGLVPGATVAYAAQVPWVRGGTVRHNIVGNAPWDAARYARVLHATCLAADLDTMGAGDATNVTATTVSGGQGARIGLARALYLPSSLLVADDVTAALDATVGAAVLRRIFGPAGGGDSGFLARDGGRGAVLATHDSRALEYAAHVIVLVRGEVVYSGPRSTCPPDALAAAGMAASPTATATPATAAAAEAVAVPSVPPPPPPAPANEDRNDDGEEGRAVGHVRGAVARTYLAGAGWGLVTLVLASLTAMQLTKNGSDWYLSLWSAVDTGAAATAAADAPLVERLAGWSDASLLAVFGGIAAASTVATAVRSWSFAAAGLAACVAVHDRLLTAVAYAPMTFHDAVPTGRLINRLSADQYSTDESLPFQLNILLAQAFGLAGTLLVLTYATSGAFLAALPVLAVAYVRLQARYRATSREVKRLDSTTRSPLFSHLTDCLTGAPILTAHSLHRTRATAADAAERAAFLGLLEPNQRTFMTAGLAGQWLSVRLQAIGAGVLFAVCLFAVALRWYTDGVDATCGDDAAPCAGTDASGGDSVAAAAGLALAYGIPVVGALQGLLGAFTETEKEAVAVERALEYTDTPAEAVVGGTSTTLEVAPSRQRVRLLASLNADAADDDAATPAPELSLPMVLPPQRTSRGAAVAFHHVTLQYASMTRPALSDVSFAVAPGERVGIAGRTGSGKSSLLAALWRLTPTRSGTISLDGTDITTLPLRALRSRLAIVPQAPLLVEGTLRFNLDPAGLLPPAALQAAMAACALPPAARNLDAAVASNGANFSVGARQLLSVCRAVAQGATLIAVDEAAASADSATELRIADSLASAAAHATVLIIAHRLPTLAACDRILLMQDGAIIEAGTPAALAANPASAYSALLRAAS